MSREPSVLMLAVDRIPGWVAPLSSPESLRLDLWANSTGDSPVGSSYT